MHRFSVAIHGIQRPPRTRAALVRIGGLGLLLVVAALIGYKLGWFDFKHTVEHVERLRKSHSMAAFTAGFILVYGIAGCAGSRRPIRPSKTRETSTECFACV